LLNILFLFEEVRSSEFKAEGIVINAPAGLEEEFVTLGFATSFDKRTKSKNTLVFVNNSREFVAFLMNGFVNTVPDSILWFAYPKVSSGIKTDINRDNLKVTAETFGITTVAAISIDNTWSALRFRPIDRVGK